MQILKEELRQAITENAKRLFLERGYEATSMRDLAKLIPMSVSNLYKYFPDKFSLYKQFVSPQYEIFLQRIQAFFDEENEGNYSEENILYVSKHLYLRLSTNRTAFLLLMENRNVPEFGDFREKLSELFCNHLLLGTTKNSGFDFLLVSIITKNIWDGLMEIIKTEENSLVQENQIHLFLKYHYKGLALFHDVD